MKLLCAEIHGAICASIQWQGIYCLCITGGDLYEELKRSGGQLKERRVAQDIIQPCLSALSYMHSMVQPSPLILHLSSATYPNGCMSKVASTQRCIRQKIWPLLAWVLCQKSSSLSLLLLHVGDKCNQI